MLVHASMQQNVYSNVQTQNANLTLAKLKFKTAFSNAAAFERILTN